MKWLHTKEINNHQKELNIDFFIILFELIIIPYHFFHKYENNLNDLQLKFILILDKNINKNPSKLSSLS